MISWRTVLGAGLLIVGGGILLDRAGLIDFGSIASTWWPMLIIAVGVLQQPVAVGVLQAERLEHAPRPLRFVAGVEVHRRIPERRFRTYHRPADVG